MKHDNRKHLAIPRTVPTPQTRLISRQLKGPRRCDRTNRKMNHRQHNKLAQHVRRNLLRVDFEKSNANACDTSLMPSTQPKGQRKPAPPIQDENDSRKETDLNLYIHLAYTRQYGLADFGDVSKFANANTGHDIQGLKMTAR